MIDIPVFAVRTAQGFYDQLLASKPDPATGKPDPDKQKAFFAAHPESARAVTIIKAKPFSSEIRQQHFQRPQCVPFHQRGRRLDAGSMVDGAGGCV
jgi:catalase